MKKASGRAKRPGSTGKGRKPRALPGTESPEVATIPSPTAVAAEAIRTGVVPLEAGGPREEIPGEAARIRMGDPDDRAIDNEYVGDETAGGSSSTPDQNSVDEIGSAYGLQEEDAAGPLHSAAEVLERRDRHRATMDEPPRRGRSYRR
jgi:hypothetical protein